MRSFIINDEVGYKDFKYLNKVLKIALKKENVKNKFFSVILVDEQTIKYINANYRKIDKVTDVISFAFMDNDQDETMLGDIYICIPQMIKQAKEYQHSQKRELSFLAVHGLLHLLGYDHTKSKEEEKIMFNKQDEILKLANITR